MMTSLRKLLSVNRGLLVLLGIVGVTGVINFFVFNQRAFLNFYYLPVVFGAYLLGRRKGVYAALLSCAIVYTIAGMNERTFSEPAAATWMRWLDLGTWGCFLLVTSYVVGTLYELKQAQLVELHDAYHGVIEIMSKFIDSVDRCTENHSRRVAELCVETARALDLSPAEVEDLRVGAVLHDIGKVDISAEVLGKAAGLSAEEYAEMQTHVDKGERLVRTVGGILKHVIPMILYHHERWDGRGYKGLKGTQIPLGARVIAIADTYDAIITDRPYRPARSHEEALRIIQEEAGKQFDPDIVDAFMVACGSAPGETERKAA
jgi:HD-GYP domain-containing protein (c-di-GMP phosphodiesterase class II)